jgi:hypothetical protein
MMAQLSPQKLENTIISFIKMLIKQSSFTCQKKHSKTAKEIYRRYPFRNRRIYCLVGRIHFSLLITLIMPFDTNKFIVLFSENQSFASPGFFFRDDK